VQDLSEDHANGTHVPPLRTSSRPPLPQQSRPPPPQPNPPGGPDNRPTTNDPGPATSPRSFTFQTPRQVKKLANIIFAKDGRCLRDAIQGREEDTTIVGPTNEVPRRVQSDIASEEFRPTSMTEEQLFSRLQHLREATADYPHGASPDRANTLSMGSNAPNSPIDSTRVREMMANQAIQANILQDLHCEDAPPSLKRKIENLDNAMLRHCIDSRTGRPLEERDELRKALLRKKMRIVGRAVQAAHAGHSPRDGEHDVELPPESPATKLPEPPSGFFDRLSDELFILGQMVFHAFTPAKTEEHSIFWTLLASVANIVIYLYMGAQYGVFLLEECLADESPCSNQSRLLSFGPQTLVDLLFKADAYGESSFTGTYLALWGARFDPVTLYEGEWWRWITSWWIHLSLVHLISNLLAFIPMSWYLERRYGWWRIFPIFFLSGLGGNFFSALLEDQCNVYAGLSGAVYGMIGTLVSDMVINFETVTQPILRIFFFLLVIGFMTYETFTTEGVSNFSHIGGLIIGLFPAFLFLKNMRSHAWEAILPFLGGIVFIGVFIIFPLVLYGVIGSGFDGQTCFCNSECVSFPRPEDERGWPYVPNFIEEDFTCSADP